MCFCVNYVIELRGDTRIQTQKTRTHPTYNPISQHQTAARDGAPKHRTWLSHSARPVGPAAWSHGSAPFRAAPQRTSSTTRHSSGAEPLAPYGLFFHIGTAAWRCFLGASVNGGSRSGVSCRINEKVIIDSQCPRLPTIIDLMVFTYLYRTTMNNAPV